MLNLFGAIGQLGRLLPGYVNGYRMAIQDNWNDLNQYNQVQQGQLANAFTEATFNPAYNMFLDRAGMSRMMANNMGMDYYKRLENYEPELNNAALQANWLDPLTNARNNMLMQQYSMSANPLQMLQFLQSAGLYNPAAGAPAGPNTQQRVEEFQNGARTAPTVTR